MTAPTTPRKAVGKTAKAVRKNSDKGSEPTLVTPKHGRGALLTGGKPGNKGGPGRPPKDIRKKAQLGFYEGLPVLAAIRDDEDQKASDRIRAVEVMGKYGGVDKIALTVEEQPEEALTPDQQRTRIEAAWERLKRVKSIEEIEEMVTKVAREQVEANV